MTQLTIAAAKRAAEALLSESCVSEGEVIIGGNILAFGRDTDGKLWLTHIETLAGSIGEKHNDKPIKPDPNSEVRRSMAKRQKRQERLRNKRRSNKPD